MLEKFIGRSVTFLLCDVDTPMIGEYLGIDHGFIILRDQTTNELCAIDRDSVWCMSFVTKETSQ